MKNIIYLIALLTNLSTYGQVSFIIADSMSFDVTKRSDTLSLPFTGFSDSAPIDLDQDGECDITIKVNLEVNAGNDFTPVASIDLENHIGDKFEVMSSTRDINIYRSSETVEVKNDTIWKSSDTYELMHESNFVTWSGMDNATWPPDSATINNVYLAFKITYDQEFSYGWLKYSGTHSFAKIYLHEVAVTKENIMTSVNDFSNQLDINIFPNPTSDLVRIELKDTNYKNLDWQIFDLSMKEISSGFLNDKFTEIDLTKFNLQQGLYIIQIKQNGALKNTHQLMKI